MLHILTLLSQLIGSRNRSVQSTHFIIYGASTHPSFIAPRQQEQECPIYTLPNLWYIYSPFFFSSQEAGTGVSNLHTLKSMVVLLSPLLQHLGSEFMSIQSTYFIIYGAFTHPFFYFLGSWFRSVQSRHFIIYGAYTHPSFIAPRQQL